MEINFARIVKNLGRLSGEELSSIFVRSERSDYDKKECVDMLQELTLTLDGLQVHHEKIAAKSKTTTRSSKKKIIREIVLKMQEMLTKYERTNEVKEWNIYFTIGQNYRNAALEVIKADHTRLVFHFVHHAYN